MGWHHQESLPAAGGKQNSYLRFLGILSCTPTPVLSSPALSQPSCSSICLIPQCLDPAPELPSLMTRPCFLLYLARPGEYPHLRHPTVTCRDLKLPAWTSFYLCGAGRLSPAHSLTRGCSSSFQPFPLQPHLPPPATVSQTTVNYVPSNVCISYCSLKLPPWSR